MKILFHCNDIAINGTPVVIFDYAFYNMEFLKNESIIISNNTSWNDQNSIEKLKKYFNIILYNDFSEVQNTVNLYKPDIAYFVKSGEKSVQPKVNEDNLIVYNTINAIHSVFCGDTNEIHGDVYAVVSPWLSSLSNYKIPFVPHMINFPNDTEENLKKSFNIDNDMIVIGRYGGWYGFDIDFVKESIKEILNVRKDIVFLFMNTIKFIDNDRAIFLEGNIDINFKLKFLNTCDAMIHARHRGESFGLSVLEFAFKNKHIITFGSSIEKNHIMYLANNCTLYNNKSELDKIFLDLQKENPYNTLYIRDILSPEVVMNKFNEIFIKNFYI